MYCSLSSCSVKEALHQLLQHWRSISKTRISTPSFIVFPCWHWASENHNGRNQELIAEKEPRICIVLSCTLVQSGSKISLLVLRSTIVKTGALWCFLMWWGFLNFQEMMSWRCPLHADMFYQEAACLVVGFKMFTSHHGGGECIYWTVQNEDRSVVFCCVVLYHMPYRRCRNWSSSSFNFHSAGLGGPSVWNMTFCVKKETLIFLRENLKSPFSKHVVWEAMSLLESSQLTVCPVWVTCQQKEPWNDYHGHVIITNPLFCEVIPGFFKEIFSHI